MRLTSFFQRLFPKRSPSGPARPRLTATEWPAIIYAIGDIHGCRTELDTLQAAIVADSRGVAGEKWIVTLGDHVDRGPRSADVLDKLCAPPPPGFQRFCLAGNHEVMMLRYLNDPARNGDWLDFGGMETIASYGIDTVAFGEANPARRKMILQSHIPQEHIDFLTEIPSVMSLPDLVLVHAGLAPGIALEEQSDDDLMWMREPFLSQGAPGMPRVVHGHTPVERPEVLPHRICIDTGAFATGVLTAACLQQGQPPRFLDTR